MVCACAGQVLGEVGKLPEIFTELEISFFLLRRLLGVKTEAMSADEQKKAGKITKLAKGEILMVNIGSTSTGARILQVTASRRHIPTSPCALARSLARLLVAGRAFGDISSVER